METTRTIQVSLKNAKDWYNSGNDTLKAIALNAFTKCELEEAFKNIKCFNHVLNALPKNEIERYGKIRQFLSGSQAALIKLQLIRRVLNDGYNMRETSGIIYYPYNPIITQKCHFFDTNIKQQRIKKITQIIIKNEKYTLLGGSSGDGGLAGLFHLDSNYGVGYSNAFIGFLGCATEEIAKHMSLYFAKEIFDAKYKGWLDYEYVND